MINTVQQAVTAFQQNAGIAPLAICDTAANLQADLAALQSLATAGKLASVTISDTLYNESLTLTPGQLAADSLALGKLFGCYDLVINGALTAQQAAGLDLGHAVSLAIAPPIDDSAADVAANLDALQALAAAGKIASITLTDTGTPALTVTAAQADADSAALAKIAPGYHLVISNAATGTLDLPAGTPMPASLAAGTDVVFQSWGTWQISDPLWTNIAFDFAAPYGPSGKVTVLDVTDAQFGAGTSIFAVAGGTPGELIARGTTLFGGTLAASNGGNNMPLTLDIESSGHGPGIFSNQGVIEVSGGVLAVTSGTAGTLHNLGTIDVAAGQMTIGAALDNGGLVESELASSLVLSGAVTNESAGQIILSTQYQDTRLQITGPLVNDGEVAASSGILEIDGAVSGSGVISVGDGSLIYKAGVAEVDLDGAVAASQQISFASGEGMLRIGDAAAFHGTIGDFTFHDRIDLIGVQADSTRYDAPSGTLTVLSGGAAVSSFALPGGSALYAYSDGQGGTLLSLEPQGTAAQITAAMLQGTSGEGPLHNWATAGGATPTVTYSFGTGWTAAEIGALQDALSLWSAVANIHFQPVAGQTVGQIDFEKTGSALSDTVFTYQNGQVVGAVVNIDTAAACWANITVLGAADPEWGNAGFSAVLHELGHAIGLDHPETYTETCWAQITDQKYYTDTMQYSVMSYFTADYSGANWGLPGGSNINPQTPMLYDIMAAQAIYGANTTTLSGNDTFGFNSTFGPASAHPIREYDFTQNPTPAVTLWSGGTNNTLDLSGFSANATVDLQPGSFSSVAGYVDNLAIAYGTRIDKVVGGAGDDSITVNADNDVIDGGGGTNTVIFSGTLAQYALSYAGPVVTVTGDGVSDSLTNVQSLRFASGPGLVISTAANAVAGAQQGSLSQPVIVVDTAADVASNLDSLQTLTAGGMVTAIHLTDGGTPNLAITPAQLTSDAAALKDIVGPFTITESASAANVSISGLAGYGNTVLFGGASSQYVVTPSGDGIGFTVTDSGTGRTSVDHLSAVSALQFSDGTEIVASQTPPVAGAISTAQITELYGAVFGRTPDVAGLAYYEAYAAANPATPFTQFAQWFLASPEYTGNPLHTYAQTSAGDQQFIADSYGNLLHRAPSAGEIGFYQSTVIAPMLAGLTAGTAAYAAAEAAAHALVLAYFSQSPEFLSDVTVTAQTPTSGQHWLVLI